jgi:hypothetical protein
MTFWTWFFLTLTVAAIAATVAWRCRAARRRDRSYTRRLEETQGYLQAQIAKQDLLVAMLAELFSLKSAGGPGGGRDELAQVALQDACRLAQCRRGALLLIEPDGKSLRLAASEGLVDLPPAEFRWRVGEGTLGRVAETGQTICVEDLPTDRRFLREELTTLESRAMAVVPLRVKNRVTGVLTVNGADGRLFEEKDVRLLGVLADQAAVAIEDAALWRELKNFNVDLAQTLVQALGAKESSTPTDAGRSRRYARAVSEELNLPEAVTQSVEYAALMRGVGKAMVGDEILKKPGKLTAEEYAQVKRAPEAGARLIAPVSFLAPVAGLVRHHREWFNGQGYPDGLAGEEIPIGARIVAVVSAWEAMSADRSYRKALSRAEAAEELKRAAGTQFDPKVVRAFLAVLEREPAAARAGRTA